VNKQDPIDEFDLVIVFMKLQDSHMHPWFWSHSKKTRTGQFFPVAKAN